MGDTAFRADKAEAAMSAAVSALHTHSTASFKARTRDILTVMERAPHKSRALARARYNEMTVADAKADYRWSVRKPWGTWSLGELEAKLAVVLYLARRERACDVRVAA